MLELLFLALLLLDDLLGNGIYLCYYYDRIVRIFLESWIRSFDPFVLIHDEESFTVDWLRWQMIFGNFDDLLCDFIWYFLSLMQSLFVAIPNRCCRLICDCWLFIVVDFWRWLMIVVDYCSCVCRLFWLFDVALTFWVFLFLDWTWRKTVALLFLLMF